MPGGKPKPDLWDYIQSELWNGEGEVGWLLDDIYNPDPGEGGKSIKESKLVLSDVFFRVALAINDHLVEAGVLPNVPTDSRSRQ